MEKPIVLTTAGHTQGNLVCDGLDCWCGSIRHGLGFTFSIGRPGGWVVSFEDFEKVYLTAKKYRETEDYQKSLASV